MTIKELEEFCVICEKGSLAKASKELFMSPQGLSRVVKNLENELNCTLLNRGISGIELTESGECLRKHADAVLKEYEVLKKEIDTIRMSTDGTVELLIAHDILRFLTPECLLGFQKKYPDIHFSFAEYPDRIVEKMLWGKEGNIALSIGPFAGEHFHVKILKKCDLRLLVYKEHPLANRKSVRIEDLAEEKLYLENSSFKINEFVQSKCWNKGFEADIVFETNGFDLCYKMCRMKKGLSVTVDFVHEDMNTDDLVVIPFEENDMTWEIGMLTLKDRACENSVEKFSEYIIEYLK